MGKRPVSDKIRHSVIVLHRTKQFSMEAIARQLGLSKRCVFNTIHRYLEHGNEGERKRGKSGRPKRFSPQAQRTIIRMVRKNASTRRESLRAIATKYNSTTNTSISYSTIRRTLIGAGLESRPATLKPGLTPEHRHKRQLWCAARMQWSWKDWSRIIWSDEATFHLWATKGKVTVWRSKDERRRRCMQIWTSSKKICSEFGTRSAPKPSRGSQIQCAPVYEAATMQKGATFDSFLLISNVYA